MYGQRPRHKHELQRHAIRLQVSEMIKTRTSMQTPKTVPVQIDHYHTSRRQNICILMGDRPVELGKGARAETRDEWDDSKLGSGK